MGGKVVFEEHPGASDLGTGDAARARRLAQCFGMHMQENCGLLEIERFHWIARATAAASRRALFRSVVAHASNKATFVCSADRPHAADARSLRAL